MAAPKLDIIVNLLTALQPFASNATTLPLNDADQPLDYSRLIGTRVIDHENRLSQLTSSLNTLYGYVTTLQTQMATIIANGLTVPQISLLGIMPDSAYYNVEVVVAAIGSQLNTLRTATGTSTALGQAVGYQNKVYEDISQTLASQTSLSSSPTVMSGLTGWVATPATAADSIKNMWITINDMRKAVQTRFSPSVYANCTAAGIVVNFNTYVDIPNNRITLYFLGNCTIPDGFYDKDGNGASLRIEDGSSTRNVYTTYINVSQANKSVSGITIDLTQTNINLYTTLTLILTYSLTNGSLVCSGTISNTVTASASPCVALTLTPLSTTSFTGSFTIPLVNKNINYTVTTYSDAGCATPVSGSAVTYSNPSISNQTYTVTGLNAATTYYVRMAVVIGGLSSSPCTLIQPVKTL